MSTDAEGKRRINHYVAVIRDGQLTGWTGRNPDLYPEDCERALEQARITRQVDCELDGYSSAYAVVVKEIYDPEGR